MTELEGNRLQTHVFAGRPVEDEPKVDVHQMAVLVNQDVAVVTILDLQDVRDDSVCSQRIDEVESCSLEFIGALRPIPLQEVLVQIQLKSLAQLVTRLRVGHDFDDSAQQLFESSVRDAPVREHKQVKLALLKDLLEMFDKLHGENVLSQIVLGLENALDDSHILLGLECLGHCLLHNIGATVSSVVFGCFAHVGGVWLEKVLHQGDRVVGHSLVRALEVLCNDLLREKSLVLIFGIVFEQGSLFLYGAQVVRPTLMKHGPLECDIAQPNLLHL